jgi:hypothetical protein
MTWRALSARPCLAAALADYPVLAGRVRVKTQSGHLQDLKVVLNDAGVGPYVYQIHNADHVIHAHM